jgi:hypothetical protein
MIPCAAAATIMSRKHLAFLLVLALTFASCTRTPPPETATEDPLNRIQRTPLPAPKNFLHKTFKVDRYVKFEFEVPAHSVSPKLQGTFQSFTTNEDNEKTSDDAANVDLLILSPEELDDFVRGRPASPRWAVSASHGQTVDYALPPTLEDPQKYYLVFQNASRKGPAKSVEADFTAYF